MYLKLYFFLTLYFHFYQLYCICISVSKWKYFGGEGKTKSGRGGGGKVYTRRCLHHQVLLKNLADNVILIIVIYLNKKNSAWREKSHLLSSCSERIQRTPLGDDDLFILSSS